LTRREFRNLSCADDFVVGQATRLSSIAAEAAKIKDEFL